MSSHPIQASSDRQVNTAAITCGVSVILLAAVTAIALAVIFTQTHSLSGAMQFMTHEGQPLFSGLGVIGGMSLFSLMVTSAYLVAKAVKKHKEEKSEPLLPQVQLENPSTDDLEVAPPSADAKDSIEKNAQPPKEEKKSEQKKGGPAAKKEPVKKQSSEKKVKKAKVVKKVEAPPANDLMASMEKLGNTVLDVACKLESQGKKPKEQEKLTTTTTEVKKALITTINKLRTFPEVFANHHSKPIQSPPENMIGKKAKSYFGESYTKWDKKNKEIQMNVFKALLPDEKNKDPLKTKVQNGALLAASVLELLKVLLTESNKLPLSGFIGNALSTLLGKSSVKSVLKGNFKKMGFDREVLDEALNPGMDALINAIFPTLLEPIMKNNKCLTREKFKVFFGEKGKGMQYVQELQALSTTDKSGAELMGDLNTIIDNLCKDLEKLAE